MNWAELLDLGRKHPERTHAMTLLRTIDLAPGIRLRPGAHSDAAALELDLDKNSIVRAGGGGPGIDLAAALAADSYVVRAGLSGDQAGRLADVLADEVPPR